MLRLSAESISRTEAVMETSASKFAAAPPAEKIVKLPARTLLQPIDAVTQLVGLDGGHSPGDKVAANSIP